MAKSKTQITVNGKEYTVLSEDSGEHVARVAYYLNQKIAEIKGTNVGMGQNMLVTLVALNLADEFLKQRDQVRAAQREINSLQEENRQLQLSGMSAGNEGELKRLQDQVAKLERENRLLEQALDRASEKKITRFEASAN